MIDRLTDDEATMLARCSDAR